MNISINLTRTNETFGFDRYCAIIGTSILLFLLIGSHLPIASDVIIISISSLGATIRFLILRCHAEPWAVEHQLLIAPLHLYSSILKMIATFPIKCHGNKETIG